MASKSTLIITFVTNNVTNRVTNNVTNNLGHCGFRGSLISRLDAYAFANEALSCATEAKRVWVALSVCDWGFAACESKPLAGRFIENLGQSSGRYFGMIHQKAR